MKRLLRMFALLSRGRQIAVTVAFVHFSILLSLTCHHLVTCRWHAPRPMIVKTICPAAAPAAIKTATPAPGKSSVAQSAKSSVVKPSPKPTAAPVAKQEKAPVGKIAAASKEKSRSAPQIEPNVLKEIAESFDAIRSEPTYSSRPALNVPVKAAVTTEEPEPAEDATYEEYLVAFLQNTLDLPEFGDVKMELEIDAYGKVIAAKILESKSAKNAKFLQEELTTLNFPIPFDVQKRHAFTVIFRNQ